MNRRCPVCRRTALPTVRGNIYRHTDTLGVEICPMSDESYALTETGKPARMWAPRRRAA
jgi:hypothetical protein